MRGTGAQPGAKPRVLVLGASGLLGNAVWAELGERFDARATVRANAVADALGLDPARTLTGVSLEDPVSVEQALERSDADAVVNCIGLVKQRPEAADPVAAIRANSLFPHQLAAACAARGARLVHVSTDCVFSGRRGNYSEDDDPDAEDLYGRSKLLGEPSGPAVTLRTSMIGREPAGARGLLEWLLAQTGTVRGYRRARFTGPTAPVVAGAIGELIEHHPGLEGTWHLGADAISKHDLLLLLRDAFDLDLEIVPDDSVEIDRTLDSSRFRAATGWTPPDWPRMVAELSAASRQPAVMGRPLAGR